ncbi:MAG TPA: 16S rRNA processing protein RimM [Eubacteriaceae bacterium]|nr:16S rRNA processing protein RimM [Eubacteriaceae bacterium]
MKQEEMMVVGKIVGSHGIKGEMKVFPLTDDIYRFDELTEIFLENKEEKRAYEVKAVRYHKGHVLLTLTGIDDRNKSELLKNKYVQILREQAVSLPEDHFFIVDLIGLDVYENNQPIGRIKDVIQTGAADLYEIETEGKTLLLPATKENILETNIEKKRMDVQVPEGLWSL